MFKLKWSVVEADSITDAVSSAPVGTVIVKEKSDGLETFKKVDEDDWHCLDVLVNTGVGDNKTVSWQRFFNDAMFYALSGEGTIHITTFEGV